jgi:hypothetical protein
MCLLLVTLWLLGAKEISRLYGVGVVCCGVVCSCCVVGLLSSRYQYAGAQGFQFISFCVALRLTCFQYRHTTVLRASPTRGISNPNRGRWSVHSKQEGRLHVQYGWRFDSSMLSARFVSSSSTVVSCLHSNTSCSKYHASLLACLLAFSIIIHPLLMPLFIVHCPKLRPMLMLYRIMQISSIKIPSIFLCSSAHSFNHISVQAAPLTRVTNTATVKMPAPALSPDVI